MCRPFQPVEGPSGAFFVIVKTDGLFAALLSTPGRGIRRHPQLPRVQEGEKAAGHQQRHLLVQEHEADM